MASSLVTNPWWTTSAGVLTTALVQVRSFAWVGPTTAGHAVVVKDKDGNIVWKAVAGTNLNDERHCCSMNCNGLNVDSIGSGVLFIYQRRSDAD